MYSTFIPIIIYVKNVFLWVINSLLCVHTSFLLHLFIDGHLDYLLYTLIFHNLILTETSHMGHLRLKRASQIVVKHYFLGRSGIQRNPQAGKISLEHPIMPCEDTKGLMTPSVSAANG